MTLFSFDKGEEISTHAAGGDAMVTVLEGTGRFTVGGDVFILTEGETLIMPKDSACCIWRGEVQNAAHRFFCCLKLTEFGEAVDFSFRLERSSRVVLTCREQNCRCRIFFV